MVGLGLLHPDILATYNNVGAFRYHGNKILALPVSNHRYIVSLNASSLQVYSSQLLDSALG